MLVASKGLLRVLVPQNHLVLLHVLDLGVLRYALFVIGIVLLDGLDSTNDTGGRKGGGIFLF